MTPHTVKLVSEEVGKCTMYTWVEQAPPNHGRGCKLHQRLLWNLSLLHPAWCVLRRHAKFGFLRRESAWNHICYLLRG
eukprot:1500142-Amphidinium_carterae.2